VTKVVCILGLCASVCLIAAHYAEAAFLVNGTWYSNICRADENPNYFFVYPIQDAEPVGAPCAFPDGTPGTVTPN